MADIANPSFRTRLQGYDRDQVHKVIDRIARTLAGTARADAIRVVELQYFYFDVKFGGYDRSQVHEYVRDAITALRRRSLAA
jgi:DivIVA domain-containing protein